MPGAHHLQRLTASVHEQTVRFVLACALVASCDSSTTTASDPTSYLNDANYRRATLEASLVNPNNGYSRLRLDHYATGAANDWDRLPEWNPVTESIAAAELDDPGGASMTSLSAAVSLSLPNLLDPGNDDSALVSLGKAAFHLYPAQLAPYLNVAVSSREAAAHYGLWVDELRGVGGLVRARMADGSAAVALTCSSCHAAVGPNGVDDGLTNANLNLGAAILDAGGGPTDPTIVDAIAAWGPGRLDVTTPFGTEPARIPDLRPLRFMTHLHQDATLAVQVPMSLTNLTNLTSLTTLAIRIETLIVTSHGQVIRPPRIVALAIAAYVVSLANALPLASAAQTASPRGAEVFASACASCHIPPALTGPPVALTVIGTDPTLGLSPDRGTGMYRVSSLHGVGRRTPLLHDGTVPSIDAMFDPTRPTSDFKSRLHGAGAVPGHGFGLDLSNPDRAALIGFLRAL